MSQMESIGLGGGGLRKEAVQAVKEPGPRQWRIWAGWMNQAKGFEALSPPVAAMGRAEKADETSNANGSEQCVD